MRKQGYPLSGPREGKVDVLFVAGEHSGDQHAALIARELKERHPEWNLAAVGGVALQREGAQLLHDLTRDSVVGLVEVLKHYGAFKQLFQSLLDWVGKYQPRVVVLVDYPGFNLRFAEALRRRGISRKGGGDVAIYQYVSPQIWAWKSGRRFRMAKILDEMGVIFPFETECYRDTKLAVSFVGHPFVKIGYQNPLSYDPAGPILLLPGSRKQAVARIFPILVEAVSTYRKRGGKRRCVCLYPSEEIHFILEKFLGEHHFSSDTVSLRSVETGSTAGAVLTSSGTMSLNCALAGIPGAVVYRAHPFTAWLGQRLIKVPCLGMANLVLKRGVYPEFIQKQARPEQLASLLTEFLKDPASARVPFAAASEELQKALRAPSEIKMIDRIEALHGNI